MLNMNFTLLVDTDSFYVSVNLVNACIAILELICSKGRRDSRSRAFRDRFVSSKVVTNHEDRHVMLNRLLTLESRLNGSLRTVRCGSLYSRFTPFGPLTVIKSRDLGAFCT